jgi:rhodanese-related sulfurtransferase
MMMKGTCKEWGIILLLCLGISGAGIGIASEVTGIGHAALLQQLQSGDKPLVIDVRTPQEYSAGHVPSAINIPHTEIAARLGEISQHKDQPVVIYCKSGRRAAIAATALQQAGFTRLLHLEGDMAAWHANGLPQER